MTISRYVYRPLTWGEQVRMTSIKRAAVWIGLLLGLLLISGCATSPGWGVVNNTGYRLTVVQDGKIAAELIPGQTTYLRASWREASLVSVLAYDTRTNYIGANTYTFSQFAPYNWQVDHVFVPEGAR
jgi:hypothetical protein